MRIAIVTDAWHPQVNGVVKTLSTTAKMLERLEHRVLVLEPSLFATIPCPTYPEIRLAWRPSARIEKMLREFEPQAIHIATEGPLGFAARYWCRRRGLPFTTSYHTQFPEYLRARVPIPLSASYACLRRFHGAAVRTMTATPTLQSHLEARNFKNIVRWSRGVDLDLFRPRAKDFLQWARPISIYVGRVAVEKNIEDFLRAPLAGTKIIVGPVAAYPVVGPIDVVDRNVTGVLDEDLGRAARAALKLDADKCRLHATRYSWEAATRQFFDNLAPLDFAAFNPAAQLAAALR